MEESLVELARIVRDDSRSGVADRWLRAFRTSVAARVQGKVYFGPGVRADVPDIEAKRGTGQSPLAIRVAVWRRADLETLLDNKIMELSSASARFRQHLPQDTRLGLLLVIVADETTDWTVDRVEHRITMALLARVLDNVGRPGTGAAGFDRIVVGLLGSDDHWFVHVRPPSAPERDASNTAGVLRAQEPDKGPGELVAVADFATATAQLKSDAILPAVASTASTASAEVQHAERPPKRTRKRRPRFLLVADEWKSHRGGLSTLNRELAIALARAGVEVHVVVPQCEKGELDHALGKGVRLVTPEPIPGITGKQLLLTRPRFDDDSYEPDVIIGHGQKLGPYAYAMKELLFPQARRLHIVHTDEERLGLAKEELGGPSLMHTASGRRKLEVKLAISASLVAGIGPFLADSIEDAMRGKERPPVFNMEPGLRECKSTIDLDDLPKVRQVLLIARAEDVHSKGLDLAISAVKWATAKNQGELGQRPTLVIRGVSEAAADAVKQRLETLALPELEVIRRDYSVDEVDLLQDLLQSRIALMPSLHEGFGLAAYEAIAVGVPVRLSAESGLAQMIKRFVVDEESKMPREILPVRGNQDEIVAAWGNAIYETLIRPKIAFTRAADLRKQIRAKVSWDKTVAELLTRLGFPR